MTDSAGYLNQNRLHLSDGPIDLIIGATGASANIEAAFHRARETFRPILSALAAELPILRTPVGAAPPNTGEVVSGPVAQRMVAACRPHADGIVTPMAAVAGSVADHMLEAMREAAPALAKIYLNNGGDIAVHLAEDARFEVGLVSDLTSPRIDGTVVLSAGDRIGGIATSGAGGRSFSLGIADAVTVLARTAAEADVAATLIANAVDLPGHPHVERVPASAEDLDSDLGERLVTVSVGPLSPLEIERALSAGVGVAEGLLSAGLIRAAALCLRGTWRTCGSALVNAGSDGYALAQHN